MTVSLVGECDHGQVTPSHVTVVGVFLMMDSRASFLDYCQVLWRIVTSGQVKPSQVTWVGVVLIWITGFNSWMTVSLMENSDQWTSQTRVN